MSAPLAQRLFAELLGTAGLLMAVIGSGIMAERLCGGNVGLALLANTVATVAALYVLIELLAPLSGAHLNPGVSLVQALRGELARRWLPAYLLAQLLGALLGAGLANAMFELQPLHLAAHERSGAGLLLAEFVASAGLLLVVLRAPPQRVAACVALYIGAAYWFTASTSFANPAATWGRMFSDSFAGIAPASVPAFVGAQLLGALAGLALHRGLSCSHAPAAH